MRTPNDRRPLVHKLRWLAHLDAAGDRAGAQRAFEALPATARGVISMLMYCGRFRGWERRIAELKRLRGLVAETPPVRGSLH